MFLTQHRRDQLLLRDAAAGFLQKLGSGLLAAAAFFLPLNVYLLAGPAGSREVYAPVYLFEVFLLTSLPIIATRAREALSRSVPRPLLWLGLAIWLMTAVSSAVNPTLLGWFHLLRLGLHASFAMAALWLWDNRPRQILIPLLAGACLQGALALAQSLNDGPVGLRVVGEAGSFISLGDSVAAQGTFSHPYILAGYSMVAICWIAGRAGLDRGGSALVVPAALAALTLGLTYSRMSVLGLLPFLILVSMSARSERNPRLISLALVVLLGTAVPAGLSPSGWAERIASSAQSGSLDGFTNGRLTFMKQATAVISDEPAWGVGPGLYLGELAERGHAAEGQQLFPVHMVPMLAAAESGILVGLLMLSFLLLIGVRALRAGPLPLGCFLAFIPFVLLDHFPYTQPQGMAAASLWVALLIALTRRQRQLQEDASS